MRGHADVVSLEERNGQVSGLIESQMWGGECRQWAGGNYLGTVEEGLGEVYCAPSADPASLSTPTYKQTTRTLPFLFLHPPPFMSDYI